MVHERLNLIVSTWYSHLELDHIYHARDNKGLGLRGEDGQQAVSS